MLLRNINEEVLHRLISFMSKPCTDILRMHGSKIKECSVLFVATSEFYLFLG